MGFDPAVIRPTATGMTIPRVTAIGDSMAISSLGMPYSTSFNGVAASVTENAGSRVRKEGRDGALVRRGSTGTAKACSHETFFPAFELYSTVNRSYNSRRG